jgi:hypothetical protein
MTEGTEAGVDALTAVIVARTVEPNTGASATRDVDERAKCRNCGATLSGSYCAACGQRRHIHRSLASIGHDILHSVFHFEGKLWRTIPELVIYPGRLTRRYVEGERAKFISPMALYLLSVFLMYAVFSFTGGPLLDAGDEQVGGVTGLQVENRAEIETIQGNIDELRAQLSDEGLTAEQRTEIEIEIAGLESERAVMEAIATGDWERVQQIGAEAAARNSDAGQAPATEPETPRTAFEERLRRGIKELADNPGLTSYKLKANGYKYSWLLVPLSIPFMWLLFFWRRDIPVYDHAVFVTYSISFMMLLLIVASLLQTAGLNADVVQRGAQVVALLHLYRQLRGTYGLSRRGALVRLFFLLIAAAIVLIVFLGVLLFIGVLG